MMKKISRFGCVLALFLVLFSCNKDETTGRSFEMSYDKLFFTIPAGLNPFEVHYFVVRDIPLNKVAYFDQNNVTDTSRWRIRPQSARITSIFGVDMEFIERVSVQFFTNDQPDRFIELYFREPVPLRIGPNLDCVPTVTNILPFLKEDRINMRIRLMLRTTSPEFVESELFLRLRAEELK